MRISHLPKKEQTLVLNLLREEVRQGVAQLTDIFTPFANNVYKGIHMEVRGFRHNGRFTTRHI